MYLRVKCLANIPRFFNFIAFIRLKTEVAHPEVLGLFTQFKKSDFRVQKKKTKKIDRKEYHTLLLKRTWSRGQRLNDN